MSQTKRHYTLLRNKGSLHADAELPIGAGSTEPWKEIAEGTCSCHNAPIETFESVFENEAGTKPKTKFEVVFFEELRSVTIDMAMFVVHFQTCKLASRNWENGKNMSARQTPGT